MQDTLIAGACFACPCCDFAVLMLADVGKNRRDQGCPFE